MMKPPVASQPATTSDRQHDDKASEQFLAHQAANKQTHTGLLTPLPWRLARRPSAWDAPAAAAATAAAAAALYK